MTCYNCSLFNVCGSLKYKRVQFFRHMFVELIEIDGVEKFCKHFSTANDVDSNALHKCIIEREAYEVQGY